VTAPHYLARRRAHTWDQPRPVRHLVSVPTVVDLSANSRLARERRPGHNGRHVVARLNQLIALQPGWDGSNAQPITEDAVMAALEVLNDIALERAPLPDISPGIDGGLLFEWRRDGFELEVWVDAAGAVTVTYEHGDSSWEGSWSDCGLGARQVLDHLADSLPVE